MNCSIKAALLVGVSLVSASLAVGVAHKAGGDAVGLLLGVYTFGFATMSGVFTIFPGGTKAKNEWGDKVRVGNVNNLSTAQVLILLTWFIGFGSVVVYFMEFHKGL